MRGTQGTPDTEPRERDIVNMSRQMENQTEDAFNEGIILPNLISHLRKILDQYPDDTQIFKELIQNAEDAGARQIKFLYDQHTFGRDPKQLVHPGLARFQGPALYAYNDALFTEQDWKGVRMLSESIKQDDPTKVGYFGMGFKSVFHLTDLPSILSGGRLGVIDPHCSFFPASAYAWNLARGGAELLQKHAHQVEPYVGVFDCTRASFREGHYNGTLFRFPLRTTPSLLSETTYDKENMTAFYESFQDDAPLVLLFLNHLESVELYTRDTNSRSARLVYSVRIAKSCVDDVRQRRVAFLNQVKAGRRTDQPIVCTYALTLETVRQGATDLKRMSYSWLVTNYYCGGQVSAIFRKLQNDPELKFPSWVGTAMPLDMSGVGDDIYELSDADGHVFCFLPLPHDRDASTGLPVHVNGFFALEQNRKYIRWPSATQTREELMNKSLLWNQCMLGEALPRAYARMLLHAIDLCNTGKAVALTPRAIYRAFPDFEKVDRRWHVVLANVYSELFNHAVIHTMAGGSSWVRAQDAIFNTLEHAEEAYDVIQRVLALNDIKVADVPAHVLSAVRRCCHINLGKITPVIVSNALRNIQGNASFPWEDRMRLFRYLLKPGKYDLLDGLELLPIANGGFRTLHSNPRRAEGPVYMGSPEHPQTLLPGLDDDLLDIDIDQDLLDMLRNAAVKGYTQVRLLTSPLIAELLPSCLPAEWQNEPEVTWDPSTHGHPPADWLESLWQYLARRTPNDLSAYEELHIVPMSADAAPMSLTRLTTTTPVIVRSLDGLCMADGLDRVLANIGVTVVDELPEYAKSLPVVCRTYVFAPTYIGVARALLRLSLHGRRALRERLLRRTDDDDKRRLRETLAKISPREMQPEYRQLLSALPLFEASGGDAAGERWVSRDEIDVAAPHEMPPVPVSRRLVDVSGAGAAALATCLGVRRLSTVELLTGIVFPDLEGAYYESADVEKLMVYVLRHYHFFCEEDAQFPRKLAALPFLPRRDLLLTANRFYDPVHETLQRIFWREDSFPTGVYGEPAMVAVLREVGLRGLTEVEPEDLLESAYQIQDLAADDSADAEKVAQKSDALLAFLQQNTGMLDADCQGEPLCRCLADIRWVRRMSTKPAWYPTSLGWYGGDGGAFAKPCELTVRSHANLVGSVMPIVADDVRGRLCDAFGWTESPTPAVVARHFANTVAAYNGAEKAKFIQMAISVYTRLSRCPAADIRALLRGQRLDDWVWHGEGFAAPESIVFTEPFMDLHPFVYSLPTEMLAFSEFFQQMDVRATCHLPAVLKMIKAKYEAGSHPADVKRDLHTCVSILNEIKSSVTEETLPALQEQLVLPIHQNSAATIRMAALDQCTYCDQEWLRQGFNMDDLDGDDDGLQFVHTNLPSSTAEALGVPSLMGRMLDAEELDFSFGQSDSLTHRLHTLLEEYTDGFAVPKELVQNADDAGATIVKILYDERRNDDARTCLIDDGMAECQGPALWAYNNAVFTDADFENITKLNGATKAKQTDKIGRFGLGFNAVYNLTDVPSFVSRNSVVIFDPHTTHLGRSIKNKAKPGIRIDVQKHKRKLRRLGNQFKPYNDVFGCNLRPDAYQESYNGTLFRFPLRTKAQAIRSEICQKHYDDSEVKTLINQLVSRAESLLLFTQNVVQLSVYHLAANARDAANPAEIFSVSKAPIRILRELRPLPELPRTARHLSGTMQQLVRNSGVLKSSTAALNQIRAGAGARAVEMPNAALILRVESSTTADGERLLRRKRNHMSRAWLVSSRMGTGSSLQQALSSDDGLLPTAAVAVPLRPTGNGDSYTPVALTTPTDEDASQHGGAVFTYMPLPVRSGLPVHVNGAFAVGASRRYLCARNEDDKCDARAAWNEALLADCACRAYVALLEDVVALAPADYSYHAAWPRAAGVDADLRPLLVAFYAAVASTRPDAPRLFSDGERFVAVSEAHFLEAGLQTSPVGPHAMRVLKDCLGSSGGGTVVSLPDAVRVGFREAAVDGVIAERSYDVVRLFKTVLLPMILQVDAEDRDTLVLYALSAGDPEVLDAIRDTPSVPVSPNGETLKSPSQLVDPTSELASLYSPEDGRFPHGSYVRPAALAALRGLGMATDRVAWEDLIERAESLSNVDSQVARKRVVVILSLLQRKLDQTPENETPDAQDVADLKKAAFLPMKRRPEQFGLRWAGDDFADDVLLPATDLFPGDAEELVCCVAPVVDEAAFPKGDTRLKALLGLADKRPSLAQVLAQLHELVHPTAEEMLGDRQRQPQLQRMFHTVYAFLQGQCVASDEARERIGDALSYKTFLLCHNRLLPPSKVALEFAHASACAPYMYGLPEPLKRNFADLLSAVGVRRRFETADFVSALHEMRDAYGDATLDRDTLRLALQLVNLLNESMAELDQTLHDVVDDHGAIFIPDARCVLRPSAELCFSEPDCQWVPTEDSVNYSHPLIPFTISKQLGVNTRRQEVLRKHSRGIGFGQKERLTTRIKRILSGYPCDKEILKELLQNADDAGSTEVHFIADRRRHRAERIFDESWRPLQGPALCVYNDRPFSETDLLGIQRLGEGSKSSDPNKTGQYGVGFNCVYHLTDVPSFLTVGPEIGETLCIFDPHAKYVPGASVDEPGRRYEDVAALRDIFTDIFPCYLEDKFPVIGATMFRFPLRDEAMAAESELSERAFTPEMLDGLLAKFRPEIFDCLLFMNSVKSVSLTDVDPRTGELRNTFTATAELTEADEGVRDEFSEFLRTIAAELQSGTRLMEDVPVKEATYVLDISDNQGYWEKWLITQRAGFAPGTAVPKAVTDAFRRHELALLPRGGVAALLETGGDGGAAAHARSRKAFCFLPLPVKLDLPMNVNAHFALDHESRRSLWYDEDGSAKSEWNRLLLAEVVAPAYATTLRRCVPQLSCATTDDSLSWMSVVDAEVPNVDRYTQLFPRPAPGVDDYWADLARSVYRHIDEQQAAVLPVVRLPDKYDDSDRAEIEWLPTRGSDEAKPYFDNLDAALIEVDDEAFPGIASGFTPRRLLSTSTPKKTRSKAGRLRAVLLACGFKLVKLPSAVYDGFVAAGVHVECVSPASVVEFFATYGREDSSCVIPTLPIAVGNTPLSGDTSLASVLDYCLLDPESFHTHVDGLPVLLTADEQLRVFDRRDPVFVSRYQALLPSCSAMFVQRRLVELDTFGRVADAGVFAQFDICALASLLGNSLPPATYCSGRPCYVLWRDTDDEACPNGRWLRTLWEFLRDEYERHLAEQCDEFLDERALAAAVLQPLREWCILPARQGGDVYDSRSRSVSMLDDNGEQYLVPIGMAVTTVDLRHGGVVNASMKRALRMLGVPELNCDLLDGTVLSPVGKQQAKPGRTISSFARMLVAGLDRPDELLQALCHSVQNLTTARPLQVDDCNVVLKYFNDTVDEWRDKADCVERLRSLPLYLTVHGSVVRLGAARAYVFPADVPVLGTDAWQHHAGVVFLRRNPLLASLHDALACPSLSAADLYAQFVLRDFDYLSAAARIAHLEHARDALLPRLRGDERDALVENLRELYFLEDTSGVARRACDFYDPYHAVFRCMLATVAAAFPPAPFDGFAWRDFMHVAGMRRDVDVDKFVEFVTDVADEAQRYPGEDTFNEARVLVTHLFQRPRLLEEGLLEVIADVRFIPCGKVSATLCRIYPARGQPREGPPEYIAFRDGVPEAHENIVWTTAHLLPDWANPFSLTKADVCAELDVDLETYREKIAAVLGVSREPTVEQIVAHTRNIVSKSERPYRHMEELTAFLKVDVMKSVYRFLQSSCMNDSRARDLLESMHCVIVDAGYTFVTPNQVVIDLYEDDQIVPYLYKLPTELGEFKNLFMYLGSTLTASADQYAMVLERMQEETSGDKLHPNEMRTAFKAVRELFATLQRLRGETLMTTQLFLPGSSGRLVRSSDLVYNNDPTYTDRIRNFDRPFLVDLRECKVAATNYEDVISLLPPDLRPALLTALVREKMESRSRATIVAYGISEKLRHQLNSRAFSLGVVRLIRHEHHRSGQPRVKQDLLDSIQEQLKKIRVYGVEKLVTYLSFRSVRIDDSESESECFVERAYSHEEGEEIWHIYVDNKMASLNEELLVSVAEVVNRIVGGLLRNSVHYLQPILSSPPHAISRVLDRLKIRPDHSVDAHQPTLPTPGSFVPIEDHHLLKDDFAEFTAGEYVGYELGDDETTGEPTILYATIIEQVLEPSAYDERGGALFTQRYRINVGEEHRPVVAYATDLYKFHRVDGFVSRNTSVNSAPTTPRTPTDGARVFTEAGKAGAEGSAGAPKRPTSTSGSASRPTAAKPTSDSTKHDARWSRPDDGSDAGRRQREDTNGHQTTDASWRHTETDATAEFTFTDSGHEEIHGGYRDMYFREEDEEQEQEHSNGYHHREEPAQAQAEPEQIPTEAQHPQPPDAGIDDEDATVEDIMNDVSDKLEEAWRLPEKQRKKIIKRLLLKWHPDKNIGAEKLATVIMQHIQSEIDRLVQGLPRPKTFENFDFDLDPRNPFAASETFKANFYNAYQFYFEQMNQRAKEHREQRERYKENFSREYSARAGYNFDVPPSFSSSNPQPAQAKRFLRQAQEDLRSADNDYEVREPAYEWVCFKAHQAAEKALKAAQFSVDAVTSFSHDLTSIAATLEDLELRRLATKLQSIVGDSGKLYNPDPIDFVVIPHDEYTMEMACDAVMCSADILERVKEFVQIRD